jgi:hypothetical protein
MLSTGPWRTEQQRELERIAPGGFVAGDER